jgi:hypothetical protein
MHKIRIIGTYFGRWPPWFPAFLLSCAANNGINWLFFTDCPIPPQAHPHISFIPCTLEQLNQMASERLGLRVAKNSYAQVDLRPAYGVLFAPHLQGYQFWGHCDFDVVWGDIRSFITERILETHDILSSRQNRLAGHFNLWRNDPKINTLFRSVPRYREAFAMPTYTRFDEKMMFDHLTALLHEDQESAPRIYWPETSVADWPELEKRARGWRWERGKLYDREGQERIYIHFMTWKKSMRKIDFRLGEAPASFSITRRGMWSRQPPPVERFIDATQLSALWRTYPVHTKRGRGKRRTTIPLLPQPGDGLPPSP